MNYKEFYNKSISKPIDFRKEQAEELDWHTNPNSILTKDKRGYAQWYTDGKLNLSYLCIDKHIKDRFGSQNGIIYYPPLIDPKEHIIEIKKVQLN